MHISEISLKNVFFFLPPKVGLKKNKKTFVLSYAKVFNNSCRGKKCSVSSHICPHPCKMVPTCLVPSGVSTRRRLIDAMCSEREAQGRKSWTSHSDFDSSNIPERLQMKTSKGGRGAKLRSSSSPSSSLSSTPSSSSLKGLPFNTQTHLPVTSPRHVTTRWEPFHILFQLSSESLHSAQRRAHSAADTACCHRRIALTFTKSSSPGNGTLLVCVCVSVWMQETWRNESFQDAPVTEGNSEGAPNTTTRCLGMPGACPLIADLMDSILPDTHRVAGAHLAICVTYRVPWDCKNTNLWDLYMWMCATINPLCMKFLLGWQKGTWPEYQLHSLAPLYENHWCGAKRRNRSERK